VQTLEEWTADGYDPVELSNVYDYGLDLVSQTQFDLTLNNLTPKTSYFLYDGHGSVRALTDDSGTITDSYTYDAFGIQLSQQVLNTTTGEMEQLSIGNLHSAIDNAYKYCGEYYDADLGLYYLRARHMNPETGRFHTLDTYEGRLGEPLSLHKYMYAHANPVMGIDPSGYFTLQSLMISIALHNITTVNVTKFIYGYMLLGVGNGLMDVSRVYLEKYYRYRGVALAGIESIGVKNIYNPISLFNSAPQEWAIHLMADSFVKSITYGITGLVINAVGDYLKSRLSLGPRWKVAVSSLGSGILGSFADKTASLVLSRMLNSVAPLPKIRIGNVLEDISFVCQVFDDYTVLFDRAIGKYNTAYSYAGMAMDYYRLAGL
jgi:RHS repeat-associated protein